MSKQAKNGKIESDWKKIGPCLYRYKNAVYYGLFKHRGKQIRRSLETSDMEFARRKLKALRNDLELTDPTLVSRMLDAHTLRFLPALFGASSSQKNTQRSIEKLLTDWKGGSRTISKIRTGDCSIWLARYSSRKPATLNQMISDARRFFDLAVSDGVIPRSPMDGIKYQKRSKPTKLTPTSEQFKAIVADLRSQSSNGHGSENSADFVELSGVLGLGQAELTAIQRQHINLSLGTIQVFRRKTQHSFIVPIYFAARPIIGRRLAAMSPEPTARLLPYDDCKKGLDAACRRLGFPHFEPRSLRRYFITNAIRAGVDVATVAAWQGHRDGGALVLKTYGDEVRLDHSLKMAALLAPKEGVGKKGALTHNR